MMVKVFTPVLILVLAALVEVEAVKGKCMRRNGASKCSAAEICVMGRKPRHYRRCDPLDQSRKCRCKKDTIKGCTNMLRESICQNNEQCVYKKNDKICKKEHSRKCRCKATTEPEIGCKVYNGEILTVPLGTRNFRVPGTCKLCDCLDYSGTRKPPFFEWCREEYGCVGMRLSIG